MEPIKVKTSQFIFMAWHSWWTLRLLIVELSRWHADTPCSVGLLWTSYQLAAETSAWQHTTFIRDRLPCQRRVSKPQSQEPSGRGPTP